MRKLFAALFILLFFPLISHAANGPIVQLLGTNTNPLTYAGPSTFTVTDQYGGAASLQVQSLTVSGNQTQNGTEVNNGQLIIVGSETVQGATLNTGSTLMNIYSSNPQSVTVANPFVQITPTSSYIVLAPVTSFTTGYVLVSVPTISTSTTANGSAYPDGMTITIASTDSTHPIYIQDNGTLSGTRAYLQNSRAGVNPIYAAVSSTMTVQFQYNLSNNGWNFIP